MTKSWDDVKSEACRLYVQEGWTLSAIRTNLEERFAFTASARAFRIKFKEWGITKDSRLRQAQDQHQIFVDPEDFNQLPRLNSFPRLNVEPSPSEPSPFANGASWRPSLSSTPTQDHSPNESRPAYDGSMLLIPSRIQTMTHRSRSSSHPVLVELRGSFDDSLDGCVDGSRVKEILSKAESSFQSGQDTILHFAAERSNVWILDYIVDYVKLHSPRMSIEMRDSNQRTALERAISAGQVGSAECLIDRGASLHFRNDSQQQPLHYAVQEAASGVMVDLLLRKGAPVDAPLTVKRGHTLSPIDLCIEQLMMTATRDATSKNNLYDIFDVLLKHGAQLRDDDPNEKPTSWTFLTAWLRWESTHTFAQWNKSQSPFRLSHYLRTGFNPLCWFPRFRCPAQSCSSLASFVFSHTPASGLADLLVRTTDMEKFGRGIVEALLRPCSQQMATRTDSSMRELLNLVLERAGGQLKGLLEMVLNLPPEEERLGLVDLLLMRELVDDEERRSAMRRIPGMDYAAGLRLAEMLLSGPRSNASQLWHTLLTYFFGNAKVLLRNKVRSSSPEVRDIMFSALRIPPSELQDREIPAIIRCVMHVFTGTLMESKTIAFGISTQQRISGAIELRQEYGLELLPVSGNSVLEMYPHLNHRNRMGTHSESGQNGWHDGDSTSDGGGQSGFGTPESSVDTGMVESPSVL